MQRCFRQHWVPNLLSWLSLCILLFSTDAAGFRTLWFTTSLHSSRGCLGGAVKLHYIMTTPLLITAEYNTGDLGQEQMSRRGPIPTHCCNVVGGLLRNECHYPRAYALYMQIWFHISGIAVKSSDQMKGTAARVRLNRACVPPPVPFHISVSVSINLIVVLARLMVTSSRLLSTATAFMLHLWWAKRLESKWPPALWWKPMQLKCKRALL